MLDLNFLKDKKVIVRGEKSGVQFGTLVNAEDNHAILHNSRRLWYWSGAASLSQLANEGVKNPAQCKFGVILNTQIITDVIEIIVCTESAISNIEEVKEWRI